MAADGNYKVGGTWRVVDENEGAEWDTDTKQPTGVPFTLFVNDELTLEGVDGNDLIGKLVMHKGFVPVDNIFVAVDMSAVEKKVVAKKNNKRKRAGGSDKRV